MLTIFTINIFAFTLAHAVKVSLPTHLFNSNVWLLDENKLLISDFQAQVYKSLLGDTKNNNIWFHGFFFFCAICWDRLWQSDNHFSLLKDDWKIFFLTLDMKIKLIKEKNQK